MKPSRNEASAVERDELCIGRISAMIRIDIAVTVQGQNVDLEYVPIRSEVDCFISITIVEIAFGL